MNLPVSKWQGQNSHEGHGPRQCPFTTNQHPSLPTDTVHISFLATCDKICI